MSDVIRCKYTCAMCGLLDVEVDVPMRESAHDVVRWMEDVAIPAVGRDHAARSPTCHPDTLTNLKIPMSGADYIGGPAKH